MLDEGIVMAAEETGRQGDAAEGGAGRGTLISTVPAQPDATVQAQRRILLD